MTTRFVRLHVRGDRLPVVRHDRPQVEDRDADVVLFGLLRRQERSLHQRAPGDHQDVIAVASQVRLAERNHEVFAGVLALVVGLAVQVLVLEKQHRIVAADRRSAAVRRRPRRSTGTRCGCRGSARRCSRPTGCDTVRRRAGSRQSARESRPGTTRCCPIGSASSTSRRESASSPARCSRRTGSRPPASACASPSRSRGRRCWLRRAAS